VPKAGCKPLHHGHHVEAALVLKTEFPSEKFYPLLTLFIRDMPQRMGIGIIAPTKYRLLRIVWICNLSHGIKAGSAALKPKNQFWRLSRAGVFAVFSEAAALNEPAHLV
jgi:hypothetical protein